MEPDYGTPVQDPNACHGENTVILESLEPILRSILVVAFPPVSIGPRLGECDRLDMAIHRPVAWFDRRCY